MVKESAYKAGDWGSNPELGRFPWRGERLSTPVFLPGVFPWTEEPGGLQPIEGCKESDRTEHAKKERGRKQPFFPLKFQWLSC